MAGGRPRKPTKLKVLEGNPGKRKLNESEPQPAAGVPDTVPEGLSAWGQRQWEIITAELDRLGLITLVDGSALEAAIKGADQARAADRAVDDFLSRVNGGTADREDFYHLSVMSNVSKKGWTQYRAFCTEFGLTPASRTRLSVEKPDKKADSVEMALCG